MKDIKVELVKMSRFSVKERDRPEETAELPVFALNVSPPLFIDLYFFIRINYTPLSLLVSLAYLI